MNSRKVICSSAALVLLSLAFSAQANGYYKFVKLGGTPSSPYIAYNKYFCSTQLNGATNCTFLGVVYGINPDL